MKEKSLFCLIVLTTILLFGCKKNDSIYVKRIWGRRLDYSMLSYDRQNMTDPLLNCDPNKPIKIVSYIDSLLCTPCFANYLEASSRYIDSIGSEKVAFICIMRPRSIEDIRLAIQDKKISKNICILFDSANSFLRTNELEEFPTHLQAFLLDKEDQVVLVGDPIRVRSVRTLYSSIISEMVQNDGLSQN